MCHDAEKNCAKKRTNAQRLNTYQSKKLDVKPQHQVCSFCTIINLYSCGNRAKNSVVFDLASPLFSALVGNSLIRYTNRIAGVNKFPFNLAKFVDGEMLI